MKKRKCKKSNTKSNDFLWRGSLKYTFSIILSIYMIGVFTVKRVPKENECLMCLQVSNADNLEFANTLNQGRARRNVIGQRVCCCCLFVCFVSSVCLFLCLFVCVLLFFFFFFCFLFFFLCVFVCFFVFFLFVLFFFFGGGGSLFVLFCCCCFVCFFVLYTGDIHPPFLLKYIFAITACMTQGFTFRKY